MPSFDPEAWIEYLDVAKMTLAEIPTHDAKIRQLVNAIDEELALIRKEIKQTLIVDRFAGRYSFLSNFYQAWIAYEDLCYPSVEHAYQAAKCANLLDRKLIQQAETAHKAKRLGRRVKLVDGWDDKKIPVMDQLLRIKFTDPYLAEQLIKTYPAKLIEGNTWNDTFWGVYNDEGENHLGKLLMGVRADLRS